MRRLVGTIALLGCVGLLAACVPARIIESDGPRVTYSWNAGETSLDRVYGLAISYCDYWQAPPRVLGEEIDGQEHKTTFACVPRATLPFGQSPAGKLLNKF